MKYAITDTILNNMARTLQSATGISIPITPAQMPTITTEATTFSWIKPFQYESVSSSIITDNATFVETAGFYCTNAQEIYLPKCKAISNNAFLSCKNLINVSLPQCSYIGNNAFNYCNANRNEYFSIYAPKCVTIGEDCFDDAYITELYLPSFSDYHTHFGYERMWIKSITLGHIFLPSFYFKDHYYLTYLSISSCTHIEGDLFGARATGSGPVALSEINLPSISYIGNEAFAGCSYIDITLYGNSIPSLGGSNIFNNIELGTFIEDENIIDEYNTEHGTDYDELYMFNDGIILSESTRTGTPQGCFWVPASMYSLYMNACQSSTNNWYYYSNNIKSYHI